MSLEIKILYSAVAQQDELTGGVINPPTIANACCNPISLREKLELVHLSKHYIFHDISHELLL